MHVVDSIAALGADRDVVILYVYADEQVRRSLDDGLVEAMAPGSLLVIHTTGSPATAPAIADRRAPRGIGVVDAAGSGGPALGCRRHAQPLPRRREVGGDVERCRQVFVAYASNITHFGALGSGQMVKLVNNLLFGCHIELALEAARLAGAFGIDATDLARTLHTCSGQSYSLDLVAMMGSAENLLATAGRFVHKDVVVALDVAASIGAPLGSFEAVTTPLLDRTAPH